MDKLLQRWTDFVRQSVDFIIEFIHLVHLDSWVAESALVEADDRWMSKVQFRYQAAMFGIASQRACTIIHLMPHAPQNLGPFPHLQ